MLITQLNQKEAKKLELSKASEKEIKDLMYENFYQAYTMNGNTIWLIDSNKKVVIGANIKARSVYLITLKNKKLKFSEIKFVKKLLKKLGDRLGSINTKCNKDNLKFTKMFGFKHISTKGKLCTMRVSGKDDIEIVKEILNGWRD